MNLLDPENLNRSDGLNSLEPFAYLFVRGQLRNDCMAALAEDFPRYPSAGFFPHEAADCGPSINQLIEELSSPPIADAIGARLGIDKLSRFPTLVTICRSLNRRHGTIHTDSRSKVVTALLYLNEQWPDTSEGCLRFLKRADSIDELVTPEIPPLYGNLVAFRRSENSYHGHLPFEGERRVIQIAWLTSDEEKMRKTRRGRFSRLFKKWFAAIDRHIGANRKDDASHLD